MKDFIRAYSMSKKGVEEEFKVEWNATLYRIGGKIFVMWGEYKDGRPLLTVKLEPALSDILPKYTLCNRSCLITQISTGLIKCYRIKRCQHTDIGNDRNIILCVAVTIWKYITDQ